MAEIDARPLVDKEGNQFFPYTDITCVNGLPDNLEALDSNDILGDIIDIKNQLATMPTVYDTWWQNITLNSGVTAFSSSETPMARLMTVGGVSFLSLKGAVKGLKATGTVGALPSNITNQLTGNRPFVQNSSVVSGNANFARWRVQSSGNIVLESTTQSTIDATHWFPIDITIMI
jgi:hypothetical protein